MSSWKEHKENQNQLMHDCDQMMMSSPSSPKMACIQHPISRLDTLPGIAIKYGVKVADIKKVNGLVTDSQMFALKTLHVPCNGSHSLPNGYSTTGHDNREQNDNGRCELFEPFQSLRRKSSEQKLSPDMSCLQNRYGTKPTMKKSASEVFNIEEYEKKACKYSEYGSFYRNSLMNRHQKSRNMANGTLDDILEDVEARKRDSGKGNGTLNRRNYKSEANLQRIPELLLKQDTNNNGGFSPRSAKGLAQRQNAGTRIALTAFSNMM
ncbi:hypothetical protein CR513_40245, partial [Mucuna pruriens]